LPINHHCTQAGVFSNEAPAPSGENQMYVKIVTIGLVKDAPINNTSITKPDAILQLLKSTRQADRERFICFHLNARNQVNAMETVSIGTLNSAQVHPREVFKAAILNNANSVILAHNHPSNDPTPSSEDIALTRRLVQAGEIIGIEVLDHLIVTPDRYLSMKEANIL
jgi:DNA repair protein RadC